jgi:hypothetical protein
MVVMRCGSLVARGGTFFTTQAVPGAVSYRITVGSCDLVSLGSARSRWLAEGLS